MIRASIGDEETRFLGELHLRVCAHGHASYSSDVHVASIVQAIRCPDPEGISMTETMHLPSIQRNEMPGISPSLFYARPYIRCRSVKAFADQ